LIPPDSTIPVNKEITMKNAEPVTPPTHMLAVACMIINGIDPNAKADPNTLITVRETKTHTVIITHRGQKFSIPHGTLDAAGQAQAQAGTDKPATTIKGGPAQPATTVKKTARKRPASATPRKTRA